ncbi:MAG: hypothetical protein WD851_06020 [Pirellulales bacterium]
MFRKLHGIVEQVDDPILNDPDNSHGSLTRTQILFQWARLIARCRVGNGQLRLSGQLLIQRLAAITPSVRLWCRHGNYAQ